MIFDAYNVNINWKDAEIFELKQIYNFRPLNNIGPVNSAHIPPIHTNIQVHLIYDYKRNRRYKARMVASGNTTGTNLDSYYSSVISIRSMQTFVSLAELEKLMHTQVTSVIII